MSLSPETCHSIPLLDVDYNCINFNTRDSVNSLQISDNHVHLRVAYVCTVTKQCESPAIVGSIYCSLTNL